MTVKYGTKKYGSNVYSGVDYRLGAADLGVGVEFLAAAQLSIFAEGSLSVPIAFDADASVIHPINAAATLGVPVLLEGAASVLVVGAAELGIHVELRGRGSFALSAEASFNVPVTLSADGWSGRLWDDNVIDGADWSQIAESGDLWVPVTPVGWNG
jgi:hypothetical protein